MSGKEEQSNTIWKKDLCSRRCFKTGDVTLATGRLTFTWSLVYDFVTKADYDTPNKYAKNIFINNDYVWGSLISGPFACKAGLITATPWNLPIAHQNISFGQFEHFTLI